MDSPLNFRKDGVFRLYHLDVNYFARCKSLQQDLSAFYDFSQNLDTSIFISIRVKNVSPCDNLMSIENKES